MVKKVLLDTNFILSCIRQKIDFFEQLELMGMQILIPQEVIGEIGKIQNSCQKLHFKEDAALALKLLEKNSFAKISLDEKEVDRGIIKFAHENPDAVIATMDREIKSEVRNRKLVIRGKKKLEII